MDFLWLILRDDLEDFLIPQKKINLRFLVSLSLSLVYVWIISKLNSKIKIIIISLTI